MYRLFHRAADLTARGCALMGGAVLLVLVVMTCLSITGRALVPFGLVPVRGDFEWIEIGTGLAIFAFLPWCQFVRGHATVDLLKRALPTLMNRIIDVVVDALMLAVAVVLAWRLWLGLIDRLSFGDTTLILRFPLWISYTACLIGAAAFVFVAAFCVVRSVAVMAGRHV